jgi:hypothetical protein
VVLTLNKNNEWVYAKEPLHYYEPNTNRIGFVVFHSGKNYQHCMEENNYDRFSALCSWRKFY